MPSVELTLFTDYFQFYLSDDDDTRGACAWSSEAVERQLDVVPGVIGVGTSRNMNAPVTVEVIDVTPAADDDCDLVTEASIDVPTGRIVVAGCTDYWPDAHRIVVAPGRYRARIYYFDQEAVSEDALDGDDRYRVVLWPDADPVAPRIVRDRRTLKPSQRAR